MTFIFKWQYSVLPQIVCSISRTPNKTIELSKMHTIDRKTVCLKIEDDLYLFQGVNISIQIDEYNFIYGK